MIEMAGEGPDRGYLEQWVTELGLTEDWQDVSGRAV